MTPATFAANVGQLSNEQVNEVLDKYPLLAEGYAALECPLCDAMCFPQRRYANDSVRYNNHICADDKVTAFTILEDGSLKGYR